MKVLLLCMLSSVLLFAGCAPEAEKLVEDVPVKDTTTEVAKTADASDKKDAATEVPVTSAKGVLGSAIAKAKAEKKNLFVHFGAPW